MTGSIQKRQMLHHASNKLFEVELIREVCAPAAPSISCHGRLSNWNNFIPFKIWGALPFCHFCTSFSADQKHTCRGTGASNLLLRIGQKENAWQTPTFSLPSAMLKTLCTPKSSSVAFAPEYSSNISQIFQHEGEGESYFVLDTYVGQCFCSRLDNLCG